MTLYVQPHQSQYQAGASSVTRHTGCTWTSGANGVDASTGGVQHRSPDEIHALVKPSEETNPVYPGWSIADLARAMKRLDVPFTNRTGTGWDGVLTQRALGRYLVVQGDSDRFGNSTCSGAYDGDHAIGVHPNTRTDPDGTILWWINDPICPAGRWERDTIIRAYAEKLWRTIYFGSFDVPVSELEPDPVNPTPGNGDANVTIRYANVTSDRRVRLAKGQICYASPGGKAVTRMTLSTSVPYVGWAGNGWYAVLIGTAVPYADKRVHRTVLYVPMAAGKVVPA